VAPSAPARKNLIMRGSWVVAVVLALSACDGTTGEVLVDGPAPERPYGGLLAVAVDANAEEVLARSGAAGRALECHGTPYQGGSEVYDNGLAEVQGSAESALQAFLDRDTRVPKGGYRVEREDGGRSLFSYDVAGRSVVTAIARDGVTDYKRHRGWGIETWASCDPSEWPWREAERAGFQVWEDARGDRVPVTTIQSFRGAEHCDWEGVTFLTLGEYGKAPAYLRRPGRDLDGFLATTYEEDATLPADARDSGYRRDGRQLWLVPGRTAAYLVSASDRADVERWPGATKPIWCA
jgi:hypothetical protein